MHPVRYHFCSRARRAHPCSPSTTIFAQGPEGPSARARRKRPVGRLSSSLAKLIYPCLNWSAGSSYIPRHTKYKNKQTKSIVCYGNYQVWLVSINNHNQICFLKSCDTGLSCSSICIKRLTVSHSKQCNCKSIFSWIHQFSNTEM